MTYWDQEDEEVLRWCQAGGPETLQERRELDADAFQMYHKPLNLPGTMMHIDARPVMEVARDIHGQIYGRVD